LDDSDEDKDYDEEKAAIDLTEQVYQDHFSTYANLPLQRDHSGERFVLALSPRYECAMSERARIIDLLSEGKIGADEAALLLRELALPPVDSSRRSSKPRFLRVVSNEPGQLNGKGTHMRIPFPLLRTVAKMAKMFPKAAARKLNRILRENGIEATFETVDVEDMETLLEHLPDLHVDIENETQILKIFCE
jgi:hypothetical protein